MATFSPSPAPRRTTRRPVANSPPIASRRTRFGSSRPTSRLATPVRAERLSVIRDNASQASGMDVDEGSSVVSERGPKPETVFAMSEELSVSFYAHLPVEVKLALKNANFYSDTFTGEIDTLTGFALVASVQTCFVWQHDKAVKGTPTCYIFSCPGGSDHTSPPFHVLVPYGLSREPGLILISLSGEIRFWDSIGIGLAGGDHFVMTSLGLNSGESVTNLIRSDPQTYIASSSSGRLFRMTLTSAGGKYRLNSHPFSRPQSSLSLSRLLPSIWTSTSSSLISESGNVSSVACGTETTLGKDVWALVDTRLQKWHMAVEGWEEIVLDEELVGIVRQAIRNSFSSASPNNSSLDLELLDLTVASSGELVILVSYAGIEEDIAMDISGIRRIYVLIWLSCITNAFKVESVSGVPYQSTSSSGAPMHPRLQLVLEGSLVAIQFGDAVALCARSSDYRDRLELKSSSDRTLGVGVIKDDSVLLVLTSATMMRACVDMDKVARFNPDTGQASLIKSIMTQAILYGSNSENPLQFRFPPEVDEDSLMQGAEQLSQAIVESDTMVVRRNHDLTTQLTERKERLSWLIQFINDNAVLTKMSQRSRQRLATDAEILYACHRLWLLHNDVLATGHTHSVLNEAAHTYMNSIAEDHHEDVMRAFFRNSAGDIGRLLPLVMDIVRRSSQERGRSLSAALPEANSIILTVLKSAFDYREYNFGVYGVELPMINPWTSEPAIVDIILELFEATTRFVESPRVDSGLIDVKKELSDQLPELASVLFACIQERLGWLRSGIAAVEPGAAHEGNELESRFEQLRPEVLETLLNNGHKQPAFALAESYRDFRSLAALCHKEVVYPPHENPNADRIQHYVAKFKGEFTTELFWWYIEHGELRLMFIHDDMYSAYLDTFFAENPFPSISWIHDLGQGRHGAASQALLNDSQDITVLETKHFMLSIGKLAHLAQLHETEEVSVDESILDAFHDGLDFVSVHETLVQEFQAIIPSGRGKQSLDSQVETIVKAEATKLSDRKALLHMFKSFVRQLLQGRALSVEEIVDVLTLRDNNNSIENYSIALHLLARAKDIPEARRMSACQAVWRRTYVYDDWDQIRRTVNVTDIELSERFQGTALYSTLKAIIPKEYQPQGCDLTPAQALPVPSLAEIAARWPNMTPDRVAEIRLNYQHESDRLAKVELDDVYHRVRELVVQDVVWEG